MNRSFACVGSMLFLLLATGCRSSVFTPDLGSHFHLPRWAGGTEPAPALPEALSGETKTSQTDVVDDSGSSGTPVPDTVKIRPSGVGSLTKNLKEGKAALREGRLSDARRAFQQVIDEDPQNSFAHHRLAIIADRNHDFPNADGHYQAASDADPNNADLLSDFGYSKLLRQDLEGSETLIQKALVLDPSNQHALNNLGWLQAKRGDYSGALATFRKVGSDVEAEKKMAVLFPQGHPGLRKRPETAQLIGSRPAIPSLTETPTGSPRRSVIPTGNEQPAVPFSSQSTPAPTVQSLDNLGPSRPASFPVESLPAAKIPDLVTSGANPDPTVVQDNTVKTISAGNPVPGSATHQPQINPSLSRAAATLGLTIGPGRL